MVLKKPAKAGTYESNDIYIMIFPGYERNTIELESVVLETFGHQIKAVIQKTLEEFNITGVLVRAIDKGALDFTIHARMTTAIKRGLIDE